MYAIIFLYEFVVSFCCFCFMFCNLQLSSLQFLRYYTVYRRSFRRVDHYYDTTVKIWTGFILENQTCRINQFFFCYYFCLFYWSDLPDRARKRKTENIILKIILMSLSMSSGYSVYVLFISYSHEGKVHCVFVVLRVSMNFWPLQILILMKLHR